MPALSETFDMAQRHRQAGELRQAETLYQQILHLNQQDAEIWYLLAETCQAQSRPADAAAYYQEALRRRPDHVDALTNLGVVLATQGKLDEAVFHFREALRLRPDYAKAHHNLGVALAEQGKLEEASQSLRQAIRLKPDYAEAYCNLGNVLVSLNQREEAVGVFKQALAVKPGYGEVYNNLGLALIDLGKVNEAAIILQQAVRLRPVAESFNNLGLAQAELGGFAEAEANYHQALRLNPNYADAHSNLGNLFKEQGRLEEAIACYQQALWLQADSPSTHWNRALAWLQMGDFEKGWAEYEWRWKRKQTPLRPFRQPMWDGSPLDGRTILLHMEQGLGDMLQFIRYAPLVKERGGTVLVECPGFLIPLFSSCVGIDRLVPEGSALLDFQVHAPLMSLPRLFGTALATIAARVPYMNADERLVESWRQKLGSGGEFKIGIAWQGNPHHKWDRHRSIPLAQFAPLAFIPDVRLISLQKGPGTEQLQDFTARFPVMDPGPELDSTSGAFMDTAAIIKNLDLVITTDTAIAHLAGALAAPVWLALSAIADWRWMFEREDSPWYATMRLFRQTELGNWQPVFERMASEVEKLLAGKGRPVSVPLSHGELIDKITILQIKSERITDPEKLAHVRGELAMLEKARADGLIDSEELTKLAAELKAVNDRLWQVEDDIRGCESAGDFGPGFIELARSVYRHNDARAALKSKINQLLRSPIAEQKEYSAYVCCPQALRLNQDHVEAYPNLGNALLAQGKSEEAIDSIQRALRLRPNYAKAFNSLGLALAAQRKLPEAVRCYEEAIRLQPEFVPTYFNVGNAYAEMRQLDKATRWYREAVRISPLQDRAQINLGNILLLQGKLGEALNSYREALRLKPDNVAAHSNLLVALNYSPSMTPESLLAEHRLWESHHGQVQRIGLFSHVDQDPLRRLRIGYVSPDFRNHAVGFFFDSILSNHDGRRFEVYCYAQEFIIDDLTRRFQSLAQVWRSTSGRSDLQVAEQIRADRIDILVDLAGHTANSRLRVFAFKPAPLQVTYLGYPNTTGLSTMDYRITDDVADPVGEPICHTEELVRLPNGFCCYAPIPEAPEVNGPPFRKTGFFTFGSTHHLAKLNDSVIDLWCEVLRSVPKSRLLVFRDTLTGKTKEEIHSRFTERGISGERVLLDPPLGWEKSHLAVYNSIDMLLDAFPFSGHTTVVESLWMGVPVVTLAGNRFAGRMAASILTRLGLNELIARTPKQYVSLAAQWAVNLDWIEQWRSSLRERMRASSLCDGREFTKSLEETYRKMWQNWCSQGDQGPRDFHKAGFNGSTVGRAHPRP